MSHSTYHGKWSDIHFLHILRPCYQGILYRTDRRENLLRSNLGKYTETPFKKKTKTICQ